MLYRTLTLILLFAALPATLPAAGIPVIGRVLGPDSKPRPQAEARLEPIPPPYERARLRMAGRTGPEPVERVRTGADGSFELTAPEAGMWQVVVTAAGVLTMEYRLQPLVEAVVLPAVELVPATDLVVRLRDAGGKPRPGEVGAFSADARGDSWFPQLRLATAVEDGVARLPLGRKETIQLEVLGRGHPLVVREIADERSVTVDLPAGKTGTFRVLDRQGQPVAEALTFQESGLVPLGLSDGEGRIDLVLATRDAPEVRVATADRRHGSFKDDGSADGSSDKSTADAGSVVEIRLDPPVAIYGRVLDLASRDPLSGALVWVVRGELAVTDSQGRYEIEMGAFRSRSVRAAAAGYLEEAGQIVEGEKTPVLALAPAAVLVGTVIGVDGDALAGVEVEVRPIPNSRRRFNFRRMRQARHGYTTSRGAFRVSGLLTEITYQLTFTAVGFAPRRIEAEPLEPFEQRGGLEVVLDAGSRAFGRVIGDDEAPIAGATVRLHAPPPGNDPMVTMWMADPSAENDEPHFTDAEGRYEIAHLAAGPYDLEVQAAGFAPTRVPGLRVSAGGGANDFGTVVLVPGASIEGRVTDPDGVAIAGAEITVGSERRGFARLAGTVSPDNAVTDAAGDFVLADLLPGRSVDLTVSKEGYGATSLTAVEPGSHEPLAIVLRPSGSLRGKVVDGDGQAIAGARVMAQEDFQTMASRGTGRRPAWGRTDDDGTFVLADVAAGNLTLTVRAEGYQQQTRQGIELKAGAELEFELVLTAGARVEGTLTTADGTPVAGAFVTVSEALEGFSMNAVSSSGQTDAEGRYRVTGAPLGQATITVRQDAGERLKRHVEIRSGTNVVDLVLERAFEIRGQVVGPDGTALGGATLSIEPVASGNFRFFRGEGSSAVSTADGRFTLKDISTGKYIVTAAREGYAAARSEPVEVNADVDGLWLELGRGVTLKGRVVGLELDQLSSLMLMATNPEAGSMRRGGVDFAGEFTFDSLGPGSWHIRAQVGDSGRSAQALVEIPEGVSEVTQDLEFGKGFTLSGVVLDGDQPLSGAQVSVSGATATPGYARTRADGRFRVEGLEAGTYQVMVMASVGVMHQEALELVGDHEMRVELTTGILSGLVLDAFGEPVAGASVQLEPLDAPPERSRFFRSGMISSDADGYFQVRHLNRGSWRVVAIKPGYAPGEATAALAGSGGAEVEIRLTATEGVSFEVVSASGLRLSEVWVTILEPAGRRVTSGRHPVIDGKVRVSTVPPGHWELLIQSGDSATVRLAVSSPGDQGRVVLPVAGSLQIRVPELEEVPMTYVNLVGPDGKPFVGLNTSAGWPMSGGQAMIPNLAPGVWSFTILHEDRTWRGSATVTSGQTAEVDLR